MKYYLVVGEASGDLHASNLMQGILQADPNAVFRFFGGDLMAKKGGEIALHYIQMAFMGFWEVIKNLRQIAKNLQFCKKDILEFNPDVVILVDYPGFNLRIAKHAKKNGYKVFYYIAPKVWAWKESRVKTLKQFVDQLFVIFPFEIDYFKKHGVDVIYEGNPLIDEISRKTNDVNSTFDNGIAEKPIISILAGSRKQEIKYNLPPMLSIVNEFPDYQFVIAGAPSLSKDVYYPYIYASNVKLEFGKTQDILLNSTVAIVTSGTATLEAALLNTPEVVCYRGNFISMLIAWLVIKVKYISLVNLIMSKEVVKELIQANLTKQNLIEEVKKLLPNEKPREQMLNDFAQLRKMLGEVGVSQRIGKKMVELLS